MRRAVFTILVRACGIVRLTARTELRRARFLSCDRLTLLLAHYTLTALAPRDRLRLRSRNNSFGLSREPEHPPARAGVMPALAPSPAEAAHPIHSFSDTADRVMRIFFSSSRLDESSNGPEGTLFALSM